MNSSITAGGTDGDARAPEHRGAVESTYLSPAQAQAVLNLVETAAGVSRRYQFFTWLQTHAHVLLPHLLAICGAYQRGRRQLHFEVFNTIHLPPRLMVALGGADSAPMAALAELWTVGQGRPYALDLDSGAADALRETADGLREAGIGRLLVHGAARPGRLHEIETLFVFGTDGDGPDPAALHVFEMITPLLHATMLRADGVEREMGGGLHRAPAGPADAQAPRLSPRERQILHGVREGRTNQEIGDDLGISALTVKNHVQKILGKLGASNRAHAVAMASKLHLIP